MRSILTALQEGRLFELPDNQKPRSLTFLARILDANPDIEVGTDAIEEIQRREQECNTGIGLGVAVPHFRARREEGELYCAIGWSAQGIDYGAQDGQQVHLVFMYYIPGAQKNVYLKEISSLVKAVRKSGGMGAISHAPDLNTVRNLLLDWVALVAGESGPEAVARMIRLDLKQGQAPVAPAAPVPTPVPVPPATEAAQATTFCVLVGPAAAPIVLTHEDTLTQALEKQTDLATALSSGGPFSCGARQIFVTGTVRYLGQRTLYYCVAVTPLKQ